MTARIRQYARMDEHAKVDVEGLGRGANVVLARDLSRRFPELLIQGDSLSILLSDLDEEAPDSKRTTGRGRVAGYL